MRSLLMNWANVCAVAPGYGARRSLSVRVLDGRGRPTLAEVRVYCAGTRMLVGTPLVDSGSGYNAQNDRPVHFAWTGDSRVDIEVT